jgi:hypothetical protein
VDRRGVPVPAALAPAAEAAATVRAAVEVGTEISRAPGGTLNRASRERPEGQPPGRLSFLGHAKGSGVFGGP